jgi:hypothetical protein
MKAPEKAGPDDGFSSSSLFSSEDSQSPETAFRQLLVGLISSDGAGFNLVHELI